MTLPLHLEHRWPPSAAGELRDAGRRPPPLAEPNSLVSAPVASTLKDRETAVRRIVATHYRFLWRSLRRLGVPESDVEDAAQHVLCVVARKIDAIVPEAERSFLFQTAWRVASDFRAARGRCRDTSAQNQVVDDNQLIDPSPPADEQMATHSARALLDGILDTMPMELRAAFILVELEELTLDDAAAVLGIPRGTVASRLRRARECFAAAAKRAEARQRFAERAP